MWVFILYPLWHSTVNVFEFPFVGVAATETFSKTIGAKLDMLLEELRLSDVFLAIDGMLTEVRQVKPVDFLGEKFRTVENSEVEDEEAIVRVIEALFSLING